MAFSQEDVRHTGGHFAAKLKAERHLSDVVHWVNKDPGAPDLVLLDTRAREAAKAALQLAELGFLAKEMNAGWQEWSEAKHPTHSGRVAPGELRCSCSRL